MPFGPGVESLTSFQYLVMSSSVGIQISMVSLDGYLLRRLSMAWWLVGPPVKIVCCQNSWMICDIRIGSVVMSLVLGSVRAVSLDRA